MGKAKINPELIDLICGHLKEGNYDVVAAQAAGITRQTFYNWIRKGKAQREGIYFDFYRRVEEAKSQGEVELITTIRKASNRTWTAAAWILERSRPQRWALHKAKENAVEFWKKELLELLKDGDITQQDIIETVGADLAYELFEQAGIAVVGRGETEAESGDERSEQLVEVSKESVGLRSRGS
jgi:predicted site-specific integrase-resolvase